MNIHEYQAKSLLRQYGVAVPEGGVAYTADEAVKVAENLGGPVYVVKAQIHAGGRGKGGGVKVVKSLDDVRTEAEKMIGMQLVTHQTGPEGKEVSRVYVEAGSDIARELYLGMLVDRATSRVTVMASTEGGMEIEEVAEKNPDAIKKVAIDPATGLQPFHARKLAFALGLEGKQVNKAVRFMMAMYKAFTELDCAIVEINPLVVTGDGDVIALDAKINFDDNALFRHADVAELRDETEEDPIELEATKHELNYVKLDGAIGCMVNGAGLAMATMDLIKQAGGEPANFLDVGGTADAARVETAFRLILKDPKVKAILVNIFGGIVRCDRVAQGIVDAYKNMGDSIQVPIIVRLQGTNADIAKALIDNSGLAVHSAVLFQEAADKVQEVLR